MTGPGAREPIDHGALAELLQALAYPVRLQLLDVLRTRKTVGEIRVHAHREARGDNPERAVARQTVQTHLEKLKEADLVRIETVEQGGRPVPSYTANPARIYAIAEELRSLVVRYAGRGLDPEETSTIGPGKSPARVRGPRLVLVHGVYEGRSYPLTAETARGGGWRVGRAAGLQVVLDYDPFVSYETAIIAPHEDGFSITDLGSKNGTLLNWVPLEPRAACKLENGDVIGVGRSLLVFIAH